MPARAFEEQNRSFTDLAAFHPRTFALTGQADPELVEGAAISANLLPLLGVEMFQGRSILPEEVGPGKGGKVVLLDYGMWQRRFGGDPEILGSSLILDNESYLVVGILPQGFYSPNAGKAKLWVPLDLDFEDYSLDGRRLHVLVSFARLKDGVTVEQANTEMRALGRQLADEFPDSNSGWSANVVPIQEHFVGDVTSKIAILQAAAGFVLLIVCANLASLILVRSERYGRELALRSALGATKQQLSLRFFSEGLVLAFLGGILGTGVALFFLKNPLTSAFLRKLFTASTPLTLNQEIRLDAKVVLYTLLLTTVTGVVLSLVPIVKAFRVNLFEIIKSEGRTFGSIKGNRVLNMFASAEVAIALVLLIGTGLMLRSFQNMSAVHLGMKTENLLLLRVHLPAHKYSEPPQRMSFVRRMLAEVRPLPGVATAGVTTTMPLKGDLEYGRFCIRGRAAESDSEILFARFGLVSPGYLESLEIPLIDGRYFRDGDDEEGAGVVVVSRAMAERYWPGENALGKEIQRTRRPLPDVPWLTVVGVVEDVIFDGATAGIEPVYYLPYPQHAEQNLAARLSLVVSTQTNPRSLMDPLRRAIRQVDDQLPIKEMQPFEEAVAASLSDQKTSTSIISTFGSVSFLLALLGIYGVLSYFVTQRSQEIGVRMAFGADSTEVVKLILRRAAILVAVGLLAGLLGATFLIRFLESQLFGVAPLDLPTFGVVVLVLSAVALVASFMPALRASRTDPNKVLKYQ